jgi:NADH-quinone oxidoreductase subunit N
MRFNTFEYALIIYFIVLNFNLFILTIDVISFYILLEIQSLSFYLLTAFDKKNQYSVESGLKYFILSSFSSICLLFGYSFFYGMTGILNLIDFMSFFINIYDNDINLYFYIVSSLLILIAFLFKLYVAPFHFWISDIYQGAPTMTIAFFGTITLLPLFYIFIKYFLLFFYFFHFFFFSIILIIAIFSMILGAIGAIYQKKIKRLIAFSSISNIGYVLIGLVENNLMLLSYSLNYFIIYILNTMGLFLIFLNLNLKKSNFFLERLTLLSGWVNRSKLLMFYIIVIFFTAAGIPPFSLFVGKILILTSLSYNLFSFLLFIIIFSAILSSFYYLRIIKYMAFDKSKKWIHLSKITYINSILLTLLVLFNIFFILNSSIVTIFTDYIVLTLFL